MGRHFDSRFLCVAAGVLLCALAASVAWPPQRELPSTAPLNAGGRVVVVRSHPESGAGAVPASMEVESVAPGAGGSASQAFRDPATGRFVEPTPDRLAAEAGPQRLSAALRTSSEGLVEEPVAASPGGVRVNLRGRFRSATFAERRHDGTLAVDCGEPAAPPLPEAAGAPAVPPPPALPGGRR